MGAWESTLIGIAAVIMAINQGFKEAPHVSAKFPKLQPPGWVSYIPIFFVLAACAVIGWKTFVQSETKLEPVIAPSLNPSFRTQRWLSRDFPVVMVMNFYRSSPEETELQAEPFIGASATLQGFVEKVQGMGGGAVGVTLEKSSEDHFFIRLAFEKHAADRILRLEEGAQVYASCEFKGSATAEEIKFEMCRLIPS